MKLFELNGRDGQAVGNADLRSIVVNEMRLQTPLFDFAEFYQMSGSADTPLKPLASAGGDERTVNNDFSGNITAPSLGSIALKILGDRILTDKAFERRYQSITSARLSDLKSFARGLARHFMNRMVNGSVNSDAKQYNGLAVRCTGEKLVTVDGGANGFIVALGNSDNAKRSQQIFIKAIDLLISRVNPTILLLNQDVKSYIEAIAKEFITLQNIDGVTDLVLTRYKGVPVVLSGRAKNDATEVITNSETLGTSSDCTSIYAIKFGERADTTFATNVGLVVDDLGLVGTQYITNVELDVDMEILSTYGAQRLRGIRLA